MNLLLAMAVAALGVWVLAHIVVAIVVILTTERAGNEQSKAPK